MQKRRTWLIKRPLQFRIVALPFFSLLVGCLVVGLNTYLFYIRQSGLVSANPDIKEALVQLNLFFIFNLVVYALLIGIFAIYVSHKIAGPVYRFERVLETMGIGDLTARANLRKEDELVDLKESLNLAIASLQAKASRDKQIAREAIAKLSTLSTSAQESLAQELKFLQQELSQIGQSFKV